jgi:hypothetical protein
MRLGASWPLGSWCDKEEYDAEVGTMRIKINETRIIAAVPRDSSRRNWPISSLKARLDNVEKKKALRPKAARGNAVAVPR